MDDHRTAEGLEHLQAAANELLAAARSFLDVAEDIVSDPDRFGGVAAGAVDILKSFTGGAQQPWERHAWETPEPDAEAGEPSMQGADDPAPEETADEPVAPAPKPARARKKPATSKVKRIVVD